MSTPEVHKGGGSFWKLEPEKYRGSLKLPIRVDEERGRIYWLFNKQVYSTEDGRLLPEDVLALANQAENRRRLALEKADALQAMTARLDKPARRERIPQDTKIAVWQRDQGRCVECGDQSELEFDHIIPLAMGGSNTMRNLQLLCGRCNRRKGATLG